VNVSFAPLRPDAIALLSLRTNIDFSVASFQLPHWFCVTARTDEGDVAGVVVCEFFTHFDATFNAVVIDRHCLTRRLYRAIFTALFSKAVRLTAEVATHNRDALRIMPRLGFVYEGYRRRGINGTTDSMMFGMLREDCVFLPGYAGGTTETMEIPDGPRTTCAGSLRYS
jgi:hypothetical protein